MEEYINAFSFETLAEAFLTFYTKEYGELNLKDIIEKVQNSKQVKKFMNKVEPLHVQLGSEDYVQTVFSIIYFSFAKPEKISAAAVALLCEWNHYIGEPQGLSYDGDLNTILFRILKKCEGLRIIPSHEETFFEKFYKHLEKLQNLKLQIDNARPISSGNASFSLTVKEIQKWPNATPAKLMLILGIQSTNVVLDDNQITHSSQFEVLLFSSVRILMRFKQRKPHLYDSFKVKYINGLIAFAEDDYLDLPCDVKDFVNNRLQFYGQELSSMYDNEAGTFVPTKTVYNFCDTPLTLNGGVFSDLKEVRILYFRIVELLRVMDESVDLVIQERNI